MALSSDYQFASVVLDSADGLGWLRRWAVHRRLRVLVGSFAYNLARDVPFTDDQRATTVLSARILTAEDGKYDFQHLGGLRRQAFGNAETDMTAVERLNELLTGIARCRWW